MYLKSLEMAGFKSFADKTRLDFDRGLTAIVGPNGCGKSNISDAIRWVLGEQSAKAMRSEQMADIIFNGTDTRKPMGMAEVSITFAECEQALGTEYHEVTVTRRVFRSGESQYLLNKTPCRLKDIQRLFMGTGIGTTSYSIMQQGRIDQVLSSHPEDRRTVFEEASGITRFKADKKEAMRKLEQTEANLARLADVLREVKRQIISLQRQAGKARRYKALRAELKALDIYAARLRLGLADGEIADIEQQRRSLVERIEGLQRDTAESEAALSRLRDSLMQTERDMATALEAAAQARGRLEHTREMIRVNTRRIEEYRALRAREEEEADKIQAQLSDKASILACLESERERAETEAREAEHALQEAVARSEQHRLELDAVRSQIQRRREESVEADAQAARLENQLLDLDSRERTGEIERERAAAEKSRLEHELAAHSRRRSEMENQLDALRRAVEEANARLAAARRAHEHRAAEAAQALDQQSRLRSEAAALAAQIALLREADARREGLPAGARRLLEKGGLASVDPAAVIGPLADHLSVPPELRLALEAVLRAWLDAVVVADQASARSALRALQADPEAAVRLLVADSPPRERPAMPAGAQRFGDWVRASESIRPLAERLTASVALFDSLDQIPREIPAGLICVTRDGAVVYGDGAAELWRPAGPMASPLARRQALQAAEAEAADLQVRIRDMEAKAARLHEEARSLAADVEAAQAAAGEAARLVAQKEGEIAVIRSEERRAAERLETVSWELEAAGADRGAGVSERAALTARLEQLRAQRDRLHEEIRAQSEELRALEERHHELQQALTEQRVRCSAVAQKRDHLVQQRDTLLAHRRELESSLQARQAGVRDAESALAALADDIRSAEAQIEALTRSASEHQARQAALQDKLAAQERERIAAEQTLSEQRAALDAAREARSKLEVRLAESRLRRQNLLDRLVAEYGGTPEQILQEPEPAWDGERMSLEAAEAAVVELRAKLEAMGPVNLVAIEEYEECEKRHAFLTAQERDLVASKEQLMELIRKINRTTTEMFRATFEQINENFQAMFKRLFGGGTAKLILADEEDILECGIEMIVRPPGRKVQSVAPLSGGERTLVAVALLFAIYQIKPSPFCFLDELDAALDDSNIGRFIGVLKDFLTQSQFVVITHNRQTMAAADILYGVTMPEKGVSSIVSMRFRDAKHGDTSASETSAAAAPESPPPSSDASSAEVVSAEGSATARP